MGEAESGRFQCEHCGRRYRWTAERAGRELRCACGETVRCPAQESDATDLYDLAPAAAPPTIASPARPASQSPLPPLAEHAPADSAQPIPAAISIQSTSPAPPLKTLDYRTPSRGKPQAALPGAHEVDPLKDFYIPLWLLGGGAVVEIIAQFLSRRTFLESLTNVGFQIVGGTLIMLVGVLLAAKIRGISLGSFWTAVLKLSSISVAPSAVADLLKPAAAVIPFGGLLVWIVNFILYFALLGMMFDLEESDTWYCVWVIFFMDLAAYVGLRSLHLI